MNNATNSNSNSNTKAAQQPATTYDEAKGIYSRLCKKAARTFSREDDASHALSAVTQAMANEWDWSQGFPLSDLKHLTPADRADALALISYILGDQSFPGVFSEINREAFAIL